MSAWRTVLRLADTNRVLLLLYENLKHHQKHMSSLHWAQLEQEALLRLLVWDTIVGEIIRIKSCLQEASLRWMLIKTIRSFPREIRDLDILVLDSEFTLFKEALAPIGYIQSDKVSGFKMELKTYRRLPNGKKVAITVDAHSRISYEGLSFVDDEEVWKQRDTANLQGSPVAVPSPEHQLVTLVLNSFFGDGGIRLCDVYEFVQLTHSHGRAESVQAIAAQYGWRLALDEFVNGCGPYLPFLTEQGQRWERENHTEPEELPTQFGRNALLRGLLQKATHDLGKGGRMLVPSWGRVGMKFASRLSRNHLRKDSWTQVFAR